MKRKFRFFSETSDDQEIIEVEGADDWEVSDKLDEAFTQNDRETRFDGVDDYYGPLE